MLKPKVHLVDEDAWSDIGRFRSSGKRFLGASVEVASQDETEEQEVSHLGGIKGVVLGYLRHFLIGYEIHRNLGSV